MPDDVLAFLDKRWQTPLDITTIDQAQTALGLPHDDDQRWQLYQHLESNPGRLAEKVRFGVSAATVTLTNREKLAGRALLLGRSEDEARDYADVTPDEWQAVKRMLTRVGLLAPTPGERSSATSDCLTALDCSSTPSGQAGTSSTSLERLTSCCWSAARIRTTG